MAIARAEELLATIETTALAQTPGSTNATARESRKTARWLLLACYVTMTNPSTRWITLRDHMIEVWMQSPGYRNTTAATFPPEVGGNHFCGRPIGTENFANWMAAQYDAGLRWNHSFMYGLHFEALWIAYKLTNRADIRTMLIEMGRYILHYAWDPLHVNAMAGARWGHRPLTGTGAAPVGMGSPGFLHDRYDEFASPGVASDPFPPLHTNPNTAPAPNYEISLVGPLVRAYQLTGEQPFLTRAHEHLRQATQYTDATTVGQAKLASDQVHHYLDTQRTSDPMYFNWNKGELQYSYAVCLNGGVPVVESAWPPYAVPTTPGEVVLIGNLPQDCRPGSHTAGQWEYACFAYYGGGALIEDYSRGGAWVVAGSGGHGADENVDACIFDFEDGTWKRLPNANNIPSQANDFVVAQRNGFGEIISGSPLGIPCPAHQYDLIHQIRTANGGGPKGSYMMLRPMYQCSTGVSGAYAFKMSMDTGLWTRLSTNATSQSSKEQQTSGWDPVTNRYYNVHKDIYGTNTMDYLDGSDWAWKPQGFSNVSSSEGANRTSFIDHTRRIMILQTDTQTLRAVNLDAGFFTWTPLAVTGPLPVASFYKWFYFPADGCYYTHKSGLFTGPGGSGLPSTELYKLQPPVYDGVNKFAGTWTASIVNVSTPLEGQPAIANQGAIHHNRFFYVPSLGCFAWICGRRDAQVALLLPP